MTAKEIEQNAIKAQADWGPYGMEAGDDVKTILYKFAIQIETLKRRDVAQHEAIIDQGGLLDSFAKGLAEIQKKIENKPRLILPG